jgi:hypothetical protein
MITVLNKSTSNDIQIIELYDFKTIYFKEDLIVVLESKMGHKLQENPTIDNYLQLHKIIFLASFKYLVNDIIEYGFGAFYNNQDVGLNIVFLSNTPGSWYHEDTTTATIVNYQGYCTICDITGELKLSFWDYFKFTKEAKLGINTMLNVNGKYYNNDDQQKFYNI